MKAVIFGQELTPCCESHYYLLDEKGIEHETYKEVYDHDKLVELSKGADVIIDCGMIYFPGDVVERLDPSVKAIIRPAMGYELIDVDACTKKGIYVANVPDYAMEEVAVMQCALILDCVRKVSLYDRHVRAGWYQKVGQIDHIYPARRMSTLSLGLLGFGRIAKNVCKYMKAFGMTVYAYDPFLPTEVFEANGAIEVKDLDEFFGKCDVISPNMPLMESTFHIINEEAISKMKDGVIIVNTGRGPLIDEKALIAALKSGKVMAAGQDVFETEPLNDPNHPYMTMDNVVLTPHIAFQTSESGDELYRKAVLFAIEAAEGGCPYATVNKNAR